MTDVAAVFIVWHLYECQNNRCKSSKSSEIFIQCLQFIFVTINEFLLIYCICKIYNLITAARKIQFVFALSVVAMALSSNLFSWGQFFALFTDWKWIEGFASISQFMFQFTILCFCWGFTTKPESDDSLIKDEKIRKELTQPDGPQE